MKFGCYAAILMVLAWLPVLGDSEFRTVTGVVVDNRGNPLPDCVVEIENANTLEVRSYITEKTGAFHFNQLFTDVDYTLQARYRKVWSRPKILSKFSSQVHPQLKLVVPVE